MTDDKSSIKERFGEWVDAAEDFADRVSGRVERGVNRFSGEVESSVDDLRDSAVEYTNRREEERQQVGNRTAEFENRADSSIRQVRNEARNMKRDAEINKAVMQRRADRFAEGVDNVVDDLKENKAPRRNHTAPIDARGNYKAVDGTVNNLNDRLDMHTAATKERIREDAEGRGEGTFSRKK